MAEKSSSLFGIDGSTTSLWDAKAEPLTREAVERGLAKWKERAAEPPENHPMVLGPRSYHEYHLINQELGLDKHYHWAPCPICKWGGTNG